MREVLPVKAGILLPMLSHPPELPCLSRSAFDYSLPDNSDTRNSFTYLFVKILQKLKIQLVHYLLIEVLAFLDCFGRGVGRRVHRLLRFGVFLLEEPVVAVVFFAIGGSPYAGSKGPYACTDNLR